jgi:hypothetical protein
LATITSACASVPSAKNKPVAFLPATRISLTGFAKWNLTPFSMAFFISLSAMAAIPPAGNIDPSESSAAGIIENRAGALNGF